MNIDSSYLKSSHPIEQDMGIQYYATKTEGIGGKIRISPKDFIVEDGIINELGLKKQYGGGPLKAINEFLENNTNFEVDRHWCDLFGKNATFNVKGYLKKLR